MCIRDREAYLTTHYAAAVADKAVGNTELAAFNLQKFDGQEASLEAIEEAVEALPVMAERKCRCV